MNKKFPKHTGVYHIRDNIECLIFEVHFRRINSLLKLPTFEYNPNPSGETTVKRQSSIADSDNLIITRICWQQKLFSPSEAELYKEEKNCITNVQKKYHQWLLEDDVQFSESVISSKKNHKRTPSNKKLKPNFENKVRCGEVFTYVHEDYNNHDLNTTLFIGGSSVATAICMYVYAAISPDTQLLMLYWYPEEHQLHIYPDFNNFEENPYYIEIDMNYRHLYAYGVHNVSMCRYVEHSKTPFFQLRTPLFTTYWEHEQNLSTLFAMPPKRVKRISLLFELRSAKNFGNNSLHVCYYTELPPNTFLEGGQLHASTHASRPISVSNICYFSYYWQLTLVCEEEFNEENLLYVYFELISIDSWERERVEGYAHYATHLLPGSDELQLQCLRPAHGIMESLHRYFIGGRCKFDFFSYFRIQRAESVKVALQSRYGCRIQSTGQLQFSCQRLIQRNSELMEPCCNRASSMTLDDIMLAYREALQHLQAVVLK